LISIDEITKKRSKVESIELLEKIIKLVNANCDL
jgi:hypothetical protein